MKVFDTQKNHQDPTILSSKMNNGILLTMLISFVSIWYYMYSLIVEETINEVDFEKLMSYCIIHFVITTFICFILFAYYANALRIVNENPHLIFIEEVKMPEIYKDFLRAGIRVIYIYWLPLLFICMFIMLLTSFANEYILIVNILLVFFLLYWVSCRKDQENYGLHFPVIIISLGFSIFFFTTVIISQEVIIEVDKSSYNVTDSISINLLPKGYMLLPQIKEIEFKEKGKYKVINAFEGKNKFRMKDITNKQKKGNVLSCDVIYKLPFLNIYGKRSKKLIIN